MTQYTLAAVLGLLFAVGTFLVLRRDVVRVVWGVIIVSQAANVYLVTMGGLSGSAPVLEGHASQNGVTDPLVQALVLTAIVIGFGTTAFALVLTYRVYEEHGTIDLRDLARPAADGRPASETDGGRPASGTDGGRPASGAADGRSASGPEPLRGAAVEQAGQNNQVESGTAPASDRSEVGDTGG